MIKYLSHINYGISPISDRVMLKASGESMFYVAYESIDVFLIVTPIDVTKYVSETFQFQLQNKLEVNRIVLSKDETNKFTIGSEGNPRIDVSIFQVLVERLPIFHQLQFHGNKITATLPTSGLMLDFLSLWFSFVASYCTLRLTYFLVGFLYKGSARRSDPVPKPKFDVETHNNRKVNYHVITTYFRGDIKLKKTEPEFYPDFSYSNHIKLKYDDIINFNQEMEKGSYYSNSYFNAMLFEFDESVEHYAIISAIVKLSPRLPVQTEKGESKSQIRILYRQAFESIHGINDKKNYTEIQVQIYDSQLVVKCSILEQQRKYILRAVEGEVKFPSIEALVNKVVGQTVKDNYMMIKNAKGDVPPPRPTPSPLTTSSQT